MSLLDQGLHNIWLLSIYSCLVTFDKGLRLGGKILEIQQTPEVLVGSVSVGHSHRLIVRKSGQGWDLKKQYVHNFLAPLITH
jgi:hypothetical protein